MKKILLAVGIILILAAIGLAVFVATFDANRFKPLLLNRIEKSVGYPVEIRDISLKFDRGLALCVKGLEVYEDLPSRKETIFELEEVSFTLRLLSFLRRAVEAGAVRFVRPRFGILRGTDGEIRIAGFNSRAPKETGAGTSSAAAFSLPFLIDEIRIEDAEIGFEDRMQKPAGQYLLRKLDIALKNVSFVRPVKFDIRAAVFSDRQNFGLKGRFHLQGTGRPPMIDEAELHVDLGATDTGELFRAVPAFGDAGLREKPEGDLVLEVSGLDPSPEGLRKLNARVRLSNGRVSLRDVQSPLEKISLDAVIGKDSLKVNDLSASFAGGRVKGSGLVDQLTGRQASSFNVSAENLQLDKALPPGNPREPGLRGILSASFQGTALGLAGPQLAQTLSGNGKLVIREGIILNLNLVREIFQQMSILPGLVETLTNRLSESYRAKLEERDTVFQPVELPFVAQNGVIASDRLNFMTDSLALSGTGQLGLNGTVSCQAMLRIDRELSKAFIQSVKELQYLTFEDGRLGFPVKVQGRIEKPMVLPDLQYIGTRLAVSKTQEMLGGLLEKALSGKNQKPQPQTSGQGASGTGSQSAGQGESSALEDILGALLQSAAEKK